MIRIHRHAALGFAIAAACTLAARPALAQTQDSAAAAASAVEPCHATVERADVSDWKTVAGEGFTFCVPAN